MRKTSYLFFSLPLLFPFSSASDEGHFPENHPVSLKLSLLLWKITVAFVIFHR